MKLLAALFGSLPPVEQLRLDEAATEVHVSAAFLEALQMSHRDLANLLRTALRADYPGERTYVWPRDVYDDSVVYEVSDGDQETLYQRSYAITDGAVTLGDAFKVIAVTQYVRAEAAAITVPAIPVTQVSAPAAESGDTELTGDLVPLVEKAVGANGLVRLKVIEAGQGSSGYYPDDVLKRDGPKVFTAGLHMYADHPTASEERDLPERSIDRLAAVLASDAAWDEQGPKGPGLYANARPFAGFAERLEELAPHIGVSIRGRGKVGTREVEGKKVRSIESIDQAQSIDFVTRAGAGGSVVALMEAARGTLPPVQTEDEMSQAELDEARRKIAELEEWKTAQERRDQAAAQIAEARTIVVDELKTFKLAEMTRDRLIGQLAANPPLKEGAIDKEALVAAVKNAAQAAIDEAAQWTGGSPGIVRGMGGTDPVTTTTPKLEESTKRIETALADL